MHKPVIILGVLAVFFICESSCQRFILPTYRPPPAPKRPIIMRAKRADDQPLWLYQGDIPRAPATGDHPFLPQYIDDIKLDPNRRVARSLGTPGVSRGGGSRQSSNRDTGPTHPGYNRRNARSVQLPKMPGGWPTLPPFNPRIPSPNYRIARSVQLPKMPGGWPTVPPFNPRIPSPNYRIARSVQLPKMPGGWPTVPPFNPQLPGPKYPWDSNPSRLPIYV